MIVSRVSVGFISDSDQFDLTMSARIGRPTDHETSGILYSNAYIFYPVCNRNHRWI